MTLSSYEQAEWDRLQKRKEDALRKKARHLLPVSARDRVSAATNVIKQNPAAEAVGLAYASAATELGKIIGGAASLTVSSESVVKQFKKAGHDVTTLCDVHNLDLKSIDSVARLGRIRWGHSGTAAFGGVVSGAAITGGTVLFAKGTIHDEGAKQAPRIGIVATAYAGDTAAVLGLAARTVASTARYYGYDPHQQEEQVFMMSVIGLGMATGTPAKTAAHAELSQLTQLLFRDATWDKLNEKVLTKIAQQFANKFSVSLTKKKLGQFVPIAGVLVGAGLNFALIDRIAAAANDAYRERFLVEKSGGGLVGTTDDGGSTVALNDGTISVIELLEQEDALPALDPNVAPLEPHGADAPRNSAGIPQENR
jgi:hypothetical protein